MADDPDLFSCTVDEFDQHVALLAERFEIVPAGAGTRSVPPGGSRSPSTTATATRCRRRRCSVARPVGSFFVTTGFVDRQGHAWWDEIAWLLAGPPVDLPPSRWLPQGLRAHALAPPQFRRA